jgi:NADH-quinone oxidoreductase subunit L
VLQNVENLPEWVGLAPLVLGLLGIATAYLFYMIAPGIPVRLAAMFPAVYRFLLNKWYFDEIYGALIVRPLIALARLLWQVGDATIIDGVPNGLAALTESGSAQVVKVQNGSLAAYAFAMLIGLVLLVSIFLLFLR